jgi:integrase
MTIATLPASVPGGQEWHVTATAPIISGQRMPPGTDPAGVSRFGEDRWDLSPLSRRHHEAGRAINWAAFPEGLRAGFKRAGWALLNLPTPAELLERAATARAEHPSTGTIAAVAQNWRRYAAWLTARGITSLAEVDCACHEQYAAHVARLPLNPRTQAAALSAVSVLWGFAPHLPAGDRVPMPQWEAEGLRHYLPAAQGSNENATAPVHPAVMSPLLVWALRFSEDFADDILAALAEHQRLRSQIAPRTSPAAGARLRALLDEHAGTGSPLPGGHAGKGSRAARSYLAAITGASLSQVSNILRDYGSLPVAGAALLDVPVTGLVHGKPWTTGIGYHEAQELAMCLAAACLIVVVYLSGLRPAEALNLRTGCCPAPALDHAGTLRYALAGDYFKGATTADGTPAPDGAARQWTVIPPVHTAVVVLEQLTTTRFLFPLRPAWLAGVPAAPPRRRATRPGTHGHRRRRGEVITARAANYRIAGFISWVNDYARRHGLGAEAIPVDPDGPVTISRFRRTIAWHIARLPGGRIALAIQYGHLRTITTSEGYSGRARHGLARVLDIETARATADYLHQLRDRLDHGEAISGPAAQRMLHAASTASTRFEGMFLSPRQARALLTDPALQVHDNPRAFLACNYDPAKALCHPGRAAGPASSHPSLDRCSPACANIARTDTHITSLHAETARLRAEIASPLTPAPLRERLTQRADALRQIADRHARTRIASKEHDDQ